GGLETDAQQAFVVRDGEAVRAMSLGGGTMLKVGPVSIGRCEPGLAYLEKMDNGAYLVGNPSAVKALVTLSFPVLGEMEGYELDAEGKRGAVLPKEALGGGQAMTIALSAASRVELAPKGQAS